MALDNAKWFDDNVYLTNKLAQLKAADADTYGSWTVSNVEQAFVNAGFAQGAEGVFAHFNQYGNTPAENISPNSHFNADQYYIFKAANLYHDDDVSAVTDAEAAYVKTAIKEAGMSAWQHYVDYGTEEGVNPSNDFDTNKYLQAKADALNAAAVDGKTTWTADEVAKAISDAGMNALSHAMQYADGTTAGEAAAPFDASGNVIDAYKVDSPISSDGQTYTLTTGADNIAGTSGDDVVNGYIETSAGTTSTFTGADVIDGKGGDDTLNITVEDVSNAGVAGQMPVANVSNVEIFNIRDVTNGGSAYDFSNVAGETEVWSNLSKGAAVTFSNLGTGTLVGVKGDGNATGLADVNFSMANKADAVNVEVKGGVLNGDALAITNVANAAGNASEATKASLVSSGSANSLGVVTLTGGTNTVTDFTVEAGKNLTATLAAPDFAATATMKVTGEGKADLGNQFDGATIDASENSGGVVLGLTAANKTVTASSGADTIDIQALNASGLTLKTGAGDDKVLNSGAVVLTANDAIDGGAGTDAISASLITLASAAKIKNFEILDLTTATTNDVDARLLTGSSLQGLTLSGVNAAATVTNVASGLGLEVQGLNAALTTIGVANAASGSSDSFTVTFANAAQAAATPQPVSSSANVTLANVETINVVSGGGDNNVNQITLDNADGLQSLALSGAMDLNVIFNGVTGKQVTSASDTTNGLKSIDGSSATGDLNIDLTTAGTLNVANAGLTIKGGSGDDMITLDAPDAGGNLAVNAGAGKDVIVSAAGVKATLAGGADDDIFDVRAATATGATEATAVFTSITDLASGDKVYLAANGSLTAGALTDATATILAGGYSNLDDCLANAINANKQVSYFTYTGTGNTYVVADVSGDGALGAGDVVVELTGTVNLATASITADATTAMADILALA